MPAPKQQFLFQQQENCITALIQEQNYAAAIPNIQGLLNILSTCLQVSDIAINQYILELKVLLAACYLQQRQPLLAAHILQELKTVSLEKDHELPTDGRDTRVMYAKIVTYMENKLNENNLILHAQRLNVTTNILRTISNQLSPLIENKLNLLLSNKLNKQLSDEVSTALREHNDQKNQYQQTVNLGYYPMFKGYVTQETPTTQEQFSKLLITTKRQLTVGNIPQAKISLHEAFANFKQIKPAILTNSLKERFSLDLQQENSICKQLIIDKLQTALTILAQTEQKFNARKNSTQPQRRAKEILDMKLGMPRADNNKNCLYQPHYELLLESLTNNFRKFWFKFENHGESANFTTKLIQLIKNNLKKIGWIKWSEDLLSWRTHSIKSARDPRTQQVTLPLLTLINAEFANYHPKVRESRLPRDLQFLQDHRKVMFYLPRT